MNTTKGQTETPLSVAVGAPGSGVERLKARLEPFERAVHSDEAFDLRGLARDAIEAAEQQEARAERYRLDAGRWRWMVRNWESLDPRAAHIWKMITDMDYATADEAGADIDAAIKQEQPHE